jgi:PKD repeat protein
VSFTDTSDGEIANWLWDFGDGETTWLRHPAHVYPLPGTFTVSLTVTGPEGSDTLERPDYVVVDHPPPLANFQGVPTSGFAPLTVAFSDESTGTVTSWSWDFGDGETATTQDVAHIYSDPGSYSVSLTVSGPAGSDTLARPDYIEVEAAPPVAEFSGDPTGGIAPLTVAFTDESTGIISAWSWDFGDGGSSVEANPSHLFGAPGSYTVRLEVGGPGGIDERIRPDYVTVVDPPPEAAFVAIPTIGEAPLDVMFIDQSSGPVTSWNWDFGNGSGSSAQHPTFRYENPGTYSITLEVEGPGGSDQLLRPDYLRVDPQPCPPPTVTSFTTVPDLWYGAGGGSCGSGATCLDLYLPDDPRVCAPTVIWFHGGGWSDGSKSSMESISLVQGLVEDGWPVVSVDYSLADFQPCFGGGGSGSYPQAYLDAKQAVDWVHTVGRLSFGLPDEVVVVGSSAGATLAAMVAATQGVGETLFDPAPGLGDYRVERAILFSAPTNFVKGGCEGYVWPPACGERCPGPANPPTDCAVPPGCQATGGYARGYPCLWVSGNCQDFTQPEEFLGERWPSPGAPPGVECGDPYSLPDCCPTMPTAIPWYDASPYFWISGEEPPFHLLHSQCDPLVPFSDAIELAAAILATGGTVSMTAVPAFTQCDRGCQHGAFGISNDDPVGYILAVLANAYVP